MNQLEINDLEFYRKKLGPMTSVAALNEAVDNDSIAGTMHFADPAKARFVRLKDALFRYATLLEKEENLLKQTG